jgi:GDP-4-dehydro-6-deoxy-D-mannose reductase
MKVLVTGATGFVGRFMVDELLRAGHQVIAAVHSLQASDRTFLQERGLPAFECDLSQRDEIIQKIKEANPEAVVHLAGIAHVIHAAQDISSLMEINAISMRHICDAVNDLGTVKPVPLIFASTALVYGQIESEYVKPVRVDEETALRPATAYAKSKAAGEFILSAYKGSKVQPYIVRPFNHTGPGQSPEFVCPGFAKKVIETVDGVIKVGNLSALRDLSDVRDIVRAYRLILEKRPSRDVFVLGSGHLVRISDVLSELINISEKSIEAVVDPVLLRPSDNAAICANFECATLDLGWKPEFSLRQTLTDLYRAVQVKA